VEFKVGHLQPPDEALTPIAAEPFVPAEGSLDNLEFSLANGGDSILLAAFPSVIS
jgi:hypothetical protein